MSCDVTARDDAIKLRWPSLPEWVICVGDRAETRCRTFS